MRFNNRKKAPVYNFVHTLLLMLLTGGVLAFLLEKYRFDILGYESYLFVIIPPFSLFVFHLLGRQIFEYDSDGEALHIKNRSIIPYMVRALNDEFPKYKLINYDILQILFFKRLYIKITSKNSGSLVLKYDISYLGRRDISDLKRSLNKVVEKNLPKHDLKTDDDRRIFT